MLFSNAITTLILIPFIRSSNSLYLRYDCVCLYKLKMHLASGKRLRTSEVNPASEPIQPCNYPTSIRLSVSIIFYLAWMSCSVLCIYTFKTRLEFMRWEYPFKLHCMKWIFMEEIVHPLTIHIRRACISSTSHRLLHLGAESEKCIGILVYTIYKRETRQARTGGCWWHIWDWGMSILLRISPTFKRKVEYFPRQLVAWPVNERIWWEIISPYMEKSRYLPSNSRSISPFNCWSRVSGWPSSVQFSRLAGSTMICLVVIRLAGRLGGWGSFSRFTCFSFPFTWIERIVVPSE